MGKDNNVEIKKEDIFLFLDALRDTGQVNMYGAAPYMVEFFGFNKEIAKHFLFEWMDSKKEEAENG